MSLAQLFNAKVIAPEVPREIASAISRKIKDICEPTSIILFGSAVEGRFREGSDLDLLLVFPTVYDLQIARKKIRALGLLHPSIPVDLIFVSADLFKSKMDVGGVCFVAKHEGVVL